jgi:hypothetical protein
VGVVHAVADADTPCRPCAVSSDYEGVDAARTHEEPDVFVLEESATSGNGLRHTDLGRASVGGCEAGFG